MTSSSAKPHRWCLQQKGRRSLKIGRLWPERFRGEKYVGSKVCKNDGRVRGRDGEYEEVWASSMNGKERPAV